MDCRQSKSLDMAAQQDFSALELPMQVPHMKHLALHTVFAGSNSSLKSINEIDSCAPFNCESDSPMPGEDMCEETLNFIRNWELKVQSSSDSIGGPRFVVLESLEAVDYSKPPRRFWRTSWICMTKRLTDTSIKFES